MSIVANFDINLRGNTENIDNAADKTEETIKKMKEKVNRHAAAIEGRMKTVADKIGAVFSKIPGGSVVNGIMGPILEKFGKLGGMFAKSEGGVARLSGKLTGFGKVVMGVTATVGILTAGLAVLVAGAFAAMSAWVGLGLASMKGIVDTQKAADRLGMSIEAVQGFAYKSKLDVEELSGLLLKMERNIGKDMGGGGSGSKNFAAVFGKVSKGASHAEKAVHGVAAAWGKLGLDAQKLRSAKPEEALGMIADGFEGIHNQAERVALAMDIFGKQGAAALKLVKGGSKGIAESLAQAKGLGIVVSGGEARQVAEAAAAMADMKRAIGGVGKTAAVTIAPFVKMIASAITDAIKWLNQYREQLIDFAYTAEYVFKNFGEYVEVYLSKGAYYAVKFANDFVNALGAIPTALGEMGTLFLRFVARLSEAWGHLKKGDFIEAWDSTVAAWKETVNESAVKIKAVMDKPEGALERALREDVQRKEKLLDQKMRDFIAEKKLALNMDQGKSKDAVGHKDNGAVERGSAEAFKIIVGDQGDKMYGKMNEQVILLRDIREALRRGHHREAAAMISGASL